MREIPKKELVWDLGRTYGSGDNHATVGLDQDRGLRVSHPHDYRLIKLAESALSLFGYHHVPRSDYGVFAQGRSFEGKEELRKDLQDARVGYRPHCSNFVLGAASSIGLASSRWPRRWR